MIIAFLCQAGIVMEAGGIAWVADLTKTPFFAMKSVANLIDTHSDSAKEFERNFVRAVQSLTEKLIDLFDEMAHDEKIKYF